MKTVVTSCAAWGLVLVVAGAATAASDVRVIEAVKSRDRAAVQRLVSQRVSVNAPDVDGTTALHWAVRADDVEMARLLLRAGAKAEATNRYGVRPLTLACINGSADMIALLLRAGADPMLASSTKETPLMLAARTGRLPAVLALVEAGADVNAKETWRGQTALMWAAAEGHDDVVRALLAKGADVQARSGAGFTPLLFAVREGRIGTATTLLDAGSPVSDALPASSTRGEGEKPAGGGESGVNALMLAVGSGHFELAAMLLDRGADPNAAPRGYTVLHQLTWIRKAGIAGSNNPAPEGSGALSSADVIRKLVAKGADVNARVTRRPPAGVTRLNMIGGTPFLLAARTADADYMRLLVELGADPHVTNADRTTPLMVAAGIGSYAPGEDPGTEPEVLEAVKYALSLGEDLNAVDDNGDTAMHGAASKHVPSVVRYLAEAGAKRDVWDVKNKEGFTPLEIAHGVLRGMAIVRSPATEAAVREVMGRSTAASRPSTSSGRP